MEDSERLVVPSEAEAIDLLKVLQLEGFTELYWHNPETGERVRFYVDLLSQVVILSAPGLSDAD